MSTFLFLAPPAADLATLTLSFVLNMNFKINLVDLENGWEDDLTRPMAYILFSVCRYGPASKIKKKRSTVETHRLFNTCTI